MEHKEWLEKISNGYPIRSLSKALGYASASTLSSHLSRGKLNCKTVIDIALFFEQSPVQALVDTGYIPAEYAATYSPLEAVKALSDEELADEVLRRMKLGGTHAAFTTPVDNLIKMPSTEQLLAGGARYAALDTEPEPGPGDPGYQE